MSSLVQHIRASIKRYSESQEAIAKAVEQKQEELAFNRKRFIDELSQLVEEISNREYPVYIGRKIRWFGYDFKAYVRDWSIEEESGGGLHGWSTKYFVFKGNRTRKVERIKGGYYFPEWDISIRDVLENDIYDYQSLSEDIRFLKGEFIPGRTNQGLSPIRSRNGRKVGEIYRKYNMV